MEASNGKSSTSAPKLRSAEGCCARCSDKKERCCCEKNFLETKERLSGDSSPSPEESGPGELCPHESGFRASPKMVESRARDAQAERPIRSTEDGSCHGATIMARQGGEGGAEEKADCSNFIPGTCPRLACKE